MKTKTVVILVIIIGIFMNILFIQFNLFDNEELYLLSQRSYYLLFCFALPVVILFILLIISFFWVLIIKKKYLPIVKKSIYEINHNNFDIQTDYAIDILEFDAIFAELNYLLAKLNTNEIKGTYTVKDKKYSIMLAKLLNHTSSNFQNLILFFKNKLLTDIFIEKNIDGKLVEFKLIRKENSGGQ